MNRRRWITNWLKTNYRGRAIVACLIGLVVLWSKVTMVLDVVYVLAFKDYERLRKYGVEVTYAEEPIVIDYADVIDNRDNRVLDVDVEESFRITIEDTDTIVIDNVVIEDIGSNWYVIDMDMDTTIVIEIKEVRWLQ